MAIFQEGNLQINKILPTGPMVDGKEIMTLQVEMAGDIVKGE
ncbi:hypothetical protein N7563_20040 [Leclercia adecarboxylata ATCC 23216 = NBRC 102595]|nr:hypothetical protein [Leclercia adecarboxylata ATCC 23216 = NBRC 102595]